MAILVTGGAGYIGSHTVTELLGAGGEVVVLDNLSNASPVVFERIEELTGRRPTFYEGDICDRALLDQLFGENSIEAVVHFAGLKAVGESTEVPLKYYRNNVCGTVTLCEAMAAAGCFRLVFSSSCTVYGLPASVPVREDFPTGATNPYGRSKLMIEELLGDLGASEPRFSLVLLRYFNPVGAHPSGRMGEDPTGVPDNLLPYITQVAVGRRPCLRIFGDDYPTRDGTGVRDYIHVVDLARGHLKALERAAGATGVFTYNLGTGQGYSVMEMLRAFEEVSGKTVPYEVVPRRSGDIAETYADPARARDELGWSAERGLPEMMADAWRWQRENPKGYA